MQNAVPTHIISGFLGAGKTTLLSHLLTQKPKNEVWAILMNEFGQIGVDQQLMPHTEGYAVKELLGGCLCCSSQLPMQIALSRLIAEQKPHRLFIEPTGLGHPAQLVEQLTEPHWHSTLHMRAPVIVIDGSRLHDETWTTQHLYQDQLRAAQVIVVSHQAQMNTQDMEALEQLKMEYQAYTLQWLMAEQGRIPIEEIDFAYRNVMRQKKPLLKVQQQFKAQQHALPEVQQLPYHYVETAQGYSVAGWKMPKRWIFDFDDLLDLLCEQENWQRIKGIFHTHQGWKAFNFNPQQFNYRDVEEGIDNRIELIVSSDRDWLDFEIALFGCLIEQ